MDVLRTNHIKLPCAEKVIGKGGCEQELWWGVSNKEKQRNRETKTKSGKISRSRTFSMWSNPSRLLLSKSTAGTSGLSWRKLQKKWSMRKAWQDGAGLILGGDSEGGKHLHMSKVLLEAPQYQFSSVLYEGCHQ